MRKSERVIFSFLNHAGPEQTSPLAHRVVGYQSCRTAPQEGLLQNDCPLCFPARTDVSGPDEARGASQL